MDIDVAEVLTSEHRCQIDARAHAAGSGYSLSGRKRIVPCAHIDRPGAAFLDHQNRGPLGQRLRRPRDERLGPAADPDKYLAWAGGSPGRDGDDAYAADGRGV